MNRHIPPIRQISSFIRRTIGLIVTLSMAQPAFAADFFLRGPQVSAVEYQSFILENHFQSFSDWQLEQILKYSPHTKSLDIALEKSITDPIGALTDFDQAIAELQSQPLNEESRELLKYILLKIDSLKIPENYKFHFHRRLASLTDILKLNSQMPIAQRRPDRELILITDKILKKFSMEDAVILVEGLPVKNFDIPLTSGGLIHQWTIVSNSYSPLIFVGEWSDFLNLVSANESFSQTLLVGNCDSASLRLDSFKSIPMLITAKNARAYMGKNCNTQLQVPPSPELNTHLGTIAPRETVAARENNKLLWLASGLLIIGAAALYVNRDKQLAIEFPF